MEKKNYKIRTYTDDDWEKSLNMILSHKPDLNFTMEYWDWRNRLSPHFDPSLVFVADENGSVIACGHAQVWDFKINRSLTIRGGLDTEVFVHHEYRRRGIATELRSFMKNNLRERGAILLIGPTLAKIYPRAQRWPDRPAFEIPNHLYHKTAYTKNLDCAALKEKVSIINNILNEHSEIRNKLMKLNFTIFLRLKGYPPFVFEASQGELSIKEGEPVGRPNVVVTASKELSSSTKTLSMIRMFFTGDVKVEGLLKNSISLLKFYRILKKVSSYTIQKEH